MLCARYYTKVPIDMTGMGLAIAHPNNIMIIIHTSTKLCITKHTT